MHRHGNLNNLQFLCENGRVHKFANSFCTPAFALQDFEQRRKEFLVEDNFENLASTSEYGSDEKVCKTEPSMVPPAEDFIKYWHCYAFSLSQTFCSFILALADIKSDSHEGSIGRHSMPVSSSFSELSVRWFLRVLLIVFPCIKACSNQDELPAYLRLLLCFVC